MELNKNIIPDSLFQKVLITLILIFAVNMAWVAFSALQNIHSMLDRDLALESREGVSSYSSHFSIRLLDFTFTKTADIDTSYTYITLIDLTSTPSKTEAMDIINSASSDEEILGLSSHPSFIVSDEDQEFWIHQIYLELGFVLGGFVLIILALVWILSFNIEEYRKLFTDKVYRWALTFFFLIFAGFMADALLYARKVNFLNEEFNQAFSPTGGISPTMIFVLALLLFVLIFLRRGIPMQNEQDLTV